MKMPKHTRIKRGSSMTSTLYGSNSRREINRHKYIKICDEKFLISFNYIFIYNKINFFNKLFYFHDII